MARPERKAPTSKRPKNPYGNKPRVEPEDLGGKDAAIVTIASAQWVNMAPADEAEDGSSDMKLVLTYKEFGDKQHILNRTSYRSLSKKLPELGDDEDESVWVGTRIPLMIAHTQDLSGDPIERVWVASLKKWDSIMAKDRKK